MAKGFKPTEELGYVLLLLPSFNSYAAKRTKESNGEIFIGITNVLDMAHYWKRAKNAQKALGEYLHIIEELETQAEATVVINRVTRDSDGQITEEQAKIITLSNHPQ